ncbi:hypothetical protein Rfer_1418 [Rhodoferax ferrireducens T118]|uniref:Uncharacterized protein n=1 Tax=Albidiferax ferrireducens (strain ATCC BAA-621 / DSM 15236 / T118) TaxID=338969 RepID=Q21YK2_ALBFT|nr:hypothetical protein [Rhodoferax ferrireducens]ABD69151.1 hypothetical protein Rfer_1418 [Rhodoferax ferrireducens T118]
MNLPRTNFVLPHGWADDFAAHQRSLRQWWYRLPAGLRSPVWSTILGSLTILGLLLAFHQVVYEAVQQGELRHKAYALQAEATWRCKALPARGASDSCLLQLSASANGSGLSSAENAQLASQ